MASVVVHALALLVLLRAPREPSSPPRNIVAQVGDADTLVTELVDLGGGGGGEAGGGGETATTISSGTRTNTQSARTVREIVSVRDPAPGVGNGNGNGDGNGSGSGSGSGNGGGNGNGFGLGDGIGIARTDIPAPPPAPIADVKPPSKARAAILVYPKRDREVEDDSVLFIARVTVDRDGDVVGARMLKTRPGSLGDQASSAIWTFRYLPALDDAGTPVRSTFEQPFQIR